MSNTRITVKPIPDAPWSAIVRRDSVIIGMVTLRNGRYYPTRAGDDEPAFWFAQVTKALRYLLTGQPGEDAHVIVLARGEAVTQYNHPAPSVADIVNAADDARIADVPGEARSRQQMRP